MGRITATCVTRALVPRRPNDPNPSGIDKGPVDHLRVRRAGAVGDQVLDTAHHGGVDKALYAYADEDAAVVDGGGLVIGSRLAVGDTVMVEVSEPRVPCVTFQHHMGGDPDWMDRFSAANRTGTYLRVLSPGRIAAGQTIELLHVPDHGVTIAGWYGDRSPDDARALLEADEADDEWSLPSALRGDIEYVLGLNATADDADDGG